MPDQIVGTQRLDNYELQIKVVTRALGGVPNNRAYALDDVSRRGGVALLRSLIDRSGRENIGIVDMEAIIMRIVKIVPDNWPYDDRSMGLVQSWKPTTPPPSPSDEKWKHPITGESLGNPWLDPIDRAGQSVLLQRDPALAGRYKELASQSPFEIVATLQDDAARRKTLTALAYTAKDHDTNPYRLDQGDPAAQAVFNETQGALIAGVWREEGRQKVRLPWSSDSAYLNRTINGALIADFDRMPFLDCDGELFRRAAGIDSALAKARHDAAAQAVAEAQNKANELARNARR